ncbi:hypothetical protein FBR05_12840 [Deltaproteobacteria bacterium PRO3]|nr:hypothetical protein [Deltaproteobacteria bacterium PRO3]
MPDHKVKITTYTLNCSFAKGNSDNAMQNCFDLTRQERKQQEAEGKKCDIFLKDGTNPKFTLICKDREALAQDSASVQRGMFSMFWSPELWSNLSTKQK